MDHYIVYHGTHVSLAVMQRAYIQEFVKHVNDMSVLEGVLLRPPVSLEEEEAWFDGLHKRKGTDQIFAILLHEQKDEERTYRYIGHTGLHRITWPRASASTGSLICDKSAHGKGAGTEAKLLLLYHAFYVQHLRTVRSEVKAFNGSSWGHLLKCGYQEVGRIPNYHPHEGGYVDEVIFYVTREHFDPIWEKYQKTKELPTLTDEQRERLEKETGRTRPKK